jgi:hypothetical protein
MISTCFDFPLGCWLWAGPNRERSPECLPDYWPDGMVYRYWTVLNDDILSPKDVLSKNFEAITCISVLEHIEDHARAMQNMVHLLVSGGVLILTTSYFHHHPPPNVYR